MRIEANQPDVWDQIIRRSHRDLFDTDYLIGMGDIYRRQFAGDNFDCERAEGIKIDDLLRPSIAPSVCRFPNAELVCNMRSGFDLPLLFTDKATFDGRFVVLASQDPLRGKADPNHLTMYTPWGFSHPYKKSRGGKIIWPIIEWLVSEGFGVYLTDVWKIWPSLHGPISKNRDLIELQTQAFEKEASLIEASLWITLGKSANSAIQSTKAERVLPLAHPTARASALESKYNIPRATFENIRAAMKREIAPELGIVLKATK